MRDATHARGLTMVELLVCLGVLGIALGSVLSVFVAGTHFAAKANRTMDAGRVARAVFDLADNGFATGGTPHGRGAVAEGKFDVDVGSPDVFYSHDFPANHKWPPAHVVQSPLALVWKCGIYEPSPYTFELDGMYNVEITVSLDENGAFDAADEVIGRWYSVVADR